MNVFICQTTVDWRLQFEFRGAKGFQTVHWKHGTFAWDELAQWLMSLYISAHVGLTVQKQHISVFPLSFTQSKCCLIYPATEHSPHNPSTFYI